jgi:hypothetical protein
MKKKQKHRSSTLTRLNPVVFEEEDLVAQVVTEVWSKDLTCIELHGKKIEVI